MKKNVLFCTAEMAENLKQDGIVIDAGANSAPYDMFSPFYVWNRVIPVPGMPDYKSRTIEGVWQGLKLIDNKIDKSLFNSHYLKKRRTPIYGTSTFSLDGEVIDYVSARKKIFQPTYEWVYDNLIPEPLKKSIYSLASNGFQVYIFDVDSNPEVGDVRSSYSHASFLVDLINSRLDEGRM